MRTAQPSQLALLTATLHRALNAGDLARAKRAFALVRRSDVRGKPVDLRRDGLWRLGVEVLMREGEMSATGHDKVQRRWGARANLPAVRAYLEALGRLYPYNRLHPRAVCEVDFYAVLFGCELYDGWVEHRHAVGRVEDGGWEEDGNGDDDDDDDAHMSARDRRLRTAKADLARRALGAMRDVAARMDALLAAGPPYNRRADMWRLRGMVALYVGDLGAEEAAAEDEVEGLRGRDEERELAGWCFRKMRENGARVDAFTVRWLDDGSGESGAEEDGDGDVGFSWSSGLPVNSSLPAR